MRIHSDNFKKLARSRGISAEQLAAAVVRPGLKASDAPSAISNWMQGRDHPRCKAQDVRRLAGALGVEVPAIAKFECTFYFHRGSPRKISLITDLIRGKGYETALNLVTFTSKRAAVDVKQALMSALADAEQGGADVGKLVVAESVSDEGPMMKRFQPKDRGRAHRILKRMSHIKIALVQKD
ncbi:MAG: 50S ribosomal protein L22 [bacterium]|nr:50S ribosomal protein L22 [Phycisphaeraceae bacterium]